MHHLLFGSLVRLEDGTAGPRAHAVAAAPVFHRTVPRAVKRALLAGLAALALSGLAQRNAHADVTAPSEASSGAAHGHELQCRGAAEATPFARTELFFGLSRPGGVVTEADFQAFVDIRVTPRFPDGLTLLSGVGQFRDSTGRILVEGSKLMILLYPRQDPHASRKIELIRKDYKQQFQQESVLRTDDVSCVSF